MTYTLEYKLVDSFFWKKIKNIKADLIANDIPGNPRVLILDDETRVEIPREKMMFRFSAKRFVVIKQQMEKESGQKINV